MSDSFCDSMDRSPPGSSVHGFSRQKYWSALPFPSPGDLSNSEIKPKSLSLSLSFKPLSYLGSLTLFIWLVTNLGLNDGCHLMRLG